MTELGLNRNEQLALEDAKRRRVRLTAQDKYPDMANPWNLPAMQCAVLNLMCEGKSAKQIGPALGISPRTVEIHRTKAFERMGCYGNSLRAASCGIDSRACAPEHGGTEVEMIATNYRRHPEALALQLVLDFACVTVRRVRERHRAEARSSRRHTAAPAPDMDAQEIPIGSTVRTPTGMLAQVIGYRGFRRDHTIRLVCRYMNPANKRFDVVQLQAKLVTVVKEGGE